jgi:hypothetical protein
VEPSAELQVPEESLGDEGEVRAGVWVVPIVGRPAVEVIDSSFDADGIRSSAEAIRSSHLADSRLFSAFLSSLLSGWPFPTIPVVTVTRCVDYTQYIRPNVINSFIIFTLLFWVDVYLTQDRLHGHVDGHFVHVDVRPHFIVGRFVSAGRFRRLPLLGNRRRRSSDTQHHRRSRHSLDRRPLRIFNQQMSLHLFPNVDVITLYNSMHNEKSKINLKIFHFQLLIEEN